MLARTLHAGLALEPLSGALAAGNAVVVKPSELAPCTSAFLAANIPKYLDPKAVKVVEGGPEVGEKLMEHRWDKVLFTGNTIRPRTSSLNRDDELATDSPCIRCLNVSSDDGRFRVSLAGSSRVGRLIMTKAAKHLTPVALELGSKCPCIVDWLDSSRDSQVRPPCALLVLQFRDRTPACVPRQNDIDADYTQVAVNRIIGAKWSTCSGQACIAIDYMLVEEKFAPILVSFSFLRLA